MVTKSVAVHSGSRRVYPCPLRHFALEFRSLHASVAQWIERRPPEPKTTVRVRPEVQEGILSECVFFFVKTSVPIEGTMFESARRYKKAYSPSVSSFESSKSAFFSVQKSGS
jgi:hypothetical protein